MGAGRTSDPSSKVGSIERAIDALHDEHPLNTEGYFGVIGTSGSDDKRQIFSDDSPATFKTFEQELTEGAEIDSGVNLTSGSSYLHSDGTRVTIRPSSKSGSPAIDIVSGNPKLATQKIHFEGSKSAAR